MNLTKYVYDIIDNGNIEVMKYTLMDLLNKLEKTTEELIGLRSKRNQATEELTDVIEKIVSLKYIILDQYKIKCGKRDDYEENKKRFEKSIEYYANNNETVNKFNIKNNKFIYFINNSDFDDVNINLLIELFELRKKLVIKCDLYDEEIESIEITKHILIKMINELKYTIMEVEPEYRIFMSSKK